MVDYEQNIPPQTTVFICEDTVVTTRSLIFRHMDTIEEYTTMLPTILSQIVYCIIINTDFIATDDMPQSIIFRHIIILLMEYISMDHIMDLAISRYTVTYEQD